MQEGRLIRKVSIAMAAVAPIVLLVTALVAGALTLPGDFAPIRFWDSRISPATFPTG